MSDSWWAKKLGVQQVPTQHRPGAPVPQAIPPQHRPMAQVPQQYAPQGQVVQPPAPAQPLPGPDPENLSEALQVKTYNEVPMEAKAVRRHGGAGGCPDCGSGNFFSSGTPGREHQHCYDCGYPIVQTGSGGGALGGKGIVATGGTHQAQSPVYVDPATLG